MTEAQILVQAVQQAATSASAAAKVLRAIVVKKQSGFAETATPNNVLRSLVTQSRRRMPQIRQIFPFFLKQWLPFAAEGCRAGPKHAEVNAEAAADFNGCEVSRARSSKF